MAANNCNHFKIIIFKFHEITKVIISLLSRNAIKQTIHLFDIIIMQIQNGRHEITKVIIHPYVKMFRGLVNTT